jgi:hypothetical protein
MKGFCSTLLITTWLLHFQGLAAAHATLSSDGDVHVRLLRRVHRLHKNGPRTFEEHIDPDGDMAEGDDTYFEVGEEPMDYEDIRYFPEKESGHLALNNNGSQEMLFQAQANEMAGGPPSGPKPAWMKGLSEAQIVEIEKEEKVMGMAAALMLIGSMAFAMALFYLANQSDPDLQESSWEMVSGITSIFCTMLFFMIFKNTWELAFGENDSSKAALLGTYFFNYYASVCIFPVGFWYFRASPVGLAAIGLLGAHFTGFAGIDAMGSFLEKVFYKSPGIFAGGLCITFVLMSFTLLISSFVRGKLCDRASPEQKEAVHAWSHQCEHTENEYFGFTMGMIISMFVRFAIGGKVPAVHANPKFKSAAAVKALIGVTVGIIFSIIFVLYALNRFLERVENAKIRRVCQICKEVCAMTTGWLFVYAFQWWFWYITGNTGLGSGLAGELMAATVLALVTSVIVITTLVVIDFIADRVSGPMETTLRDLNHPCILAVGLSWEAVFYNAISGLVDPIQDEKTKKGTHVGVMILVCIIMLPGWWRFMVPKTLHDHGHGEHGHGEHGEHGEHDEHGEHHDIHGDGEGSESIDVKLLDPSMARVEARRSRRSSIRKSQIQY